MCVAERIIRLFAERLTLTELQGMLRNVGKHVRYLVSTNHLCKGVLILSQAFFGGSIIFIYEPTDSQLCFV